MNEMLGRHGGLFQADAVFPFQFFATLPSQAPRMKGEFRLLIAVLENAINCYQKYLLSTDSRLRQLHTEAAQWFSEDESVASSPDEVPALSFNYVCEVLGIEPGYLRRGLEDWCQTQINQADRK